MVVVVRGGGWGEVTVVMWACCEGRLGCEQAMIVRGDS